MKFKTRIASILLCGTLLLSSVPMASAVGGFTHVSGWFDPSLREMQELDILPASFEGFDLSVEITRAEMCELAVHALEKIMGYSITPERNDYFTDANADYIVKAYELGIVDGYGDGTFHPNERLTRQEFFQIIMNFCYASAFLPTADNSYLNPFGDAETVAEWAQDAAEVCVKYGYVNGTADGDDVYLDPNGYATREQAMAMFLRAYKSLRDYYFHILNAEVVVTPVAPPPNVETGHNTVVEDVKITGVSKHMMVTSQGLNIRSSWSKDSELLGTVNFGADLTVTGLCENGWVQVSYNGQTGYVKGDYVQDYPQDNVAPAPSSVAEEAAKLARTFVGYSYVYGAQDPSVGFDCSGLVYYSFGQNGVKLKRTANDQLHNNGTPVSRDGLQVGDLVFFGHGDYANHVGIYIGNNNFVHAANPSSGVRISSLNETYYNTRYIGARRIA